MLHIRGEEIRHPQHIQCMGEAFKEVRKRGRVLISPTSGMGVTQKIRHNSEVFARVRLTK